MRLSSGNNFGVVTVFHTLPLNTTKQQVRSGAFEESTHHFNPQKKCSFRDCTSMNSSMEIPEGTLLVVQALMDIRVYIDSLKELLGTARFRMLCSAAGLDEGGPSELVRLDEIGHVAIRKVRTHGNI